MKSTGFTRTLMGQLTVGTYDGSENRIQLFDGRFDTGYVITAFKIAPANPLDALAIMGKVSTEPKSTTTEFNWEDNEEVAWATWNIGAGYDGSFEYSNIRKDNLIIEDLYIGIGSASAGEVNYELTLEKYDITDWTGALAMVRNRSQA